MSLVKCPRCSSEVESLVIVDAGFRSRLQLSGQSQVVADEVCNNCYQELGMLLSSPTNLENTKDKMKEASKLRLWKSRVSLIRKARGQMQKKNFSDAVISYEKYLKILDVIFNTNQETINPEMIKEHGATKELTVIASVYWDLVRIYDSNERYKNRMIQMGNKLAQFARFTPMHVDLMKQAEAYKRKAKNPDVINKILKQMAIKKSRCFIATSAFESPYTDEVIFLSFWRDESLMTNPIGQFFVKIYYLFSPHVARILDEISILKPLIRLVLRFLIICISKKTPKNLPTTIVSKSLIP